MSTADALALRIAWIGLGNLGQPMALNLQKHLSSKNAAHPLTVYNRTASKADPTVEAGAKKASSVEEISRGGFDVVITSLANDAAVEEVYSVLLQGTEAAGISTLLIETSTIYPTLSASLEERAKKVDGRRFVQAPVFGPPPMAREAKLVVVTGGEDSARKLAGEILVPAVGRKVLDAGSSVKAASTLKLLGNSLILGLVELLGESLTLADKTEVGADLLYEFVKEFLPAPSAIGYGGKIVSDNFASNGGFTISGGLKDAIHMLTLARENNSPLPTIEAAHRNLLTSRALGGGDLDWSSLVGGSRVASGQHPRKRASSASGRGRR